MLLAQEPRLMLVDEPAAGMTPEEREKTTDILKEAAKTRAVVVVEHDMEFVRRLNCFGWPFRGRCRDPMN